MAKDPIPKRPAEIAPDLEALYSGAAIYANRIYVTMIIPSGVRVSFVERSEGGKELFRTAAFLSILDAIELRDLLIRQLETVQVDLKIGEEGR